MKSKNLKTLLIVCIFALISVALTGCTSNQYDKATALLEDENYEDALKLFSKLDDYNDSKEKAELCERMIGMQDNADNDFLAKIEESVLYRMKASSGDADYSAMVNTELAYVGEFADESFYDSKLKKIANNYIDGLNMQKEALAAGSESEHQIEWQRGMVTRFKALCDLYEEYDFLKDNNEFIGAYIAKYDDEKALLDAYDAIESDIHEQMIDFYFDVLDYEACWTLTNNTEYTFSTVFEANFKDANGTIVDSGECYIENITPGSSYKISFYLSSPNSVETCDWNNYYVDIKA